MTSRPVLTAKVGRNADLFADIARLYIPENARVIDMTWGRGHFWHGLDTSRYQLTRNDAVTDADTHDDFRALALPAGVFDVAVFDPPYARHGSGDVQIGTARTYALNLTSSMGRARILLDVYRDGAAEARRVLRRGGVLILKCQDQYDAKQTFMHALLLSLDGFETEDLFVLVQTGVPAMRHTYQKHARKNHSYFIVYRKRHDD